MPGISLVCDFNGNLQLKQQYLRASTDSLICNEDHRSTILLDERFCFLAYTFYSYYPVALFHQGDRLIYLEGKIYGKSAEQLAAEIDHVSELLFQLGDQPKRQLSQWLLTTDGEFILLVKSKSLDAITILTDALGRLPLYYAQYNGELIVSRDTRFIARLKSGEKFDRMAIAQHLLFGYPLGNRTLLSETYRLAPSGLIRIDFKSRTTVVEHLLSFNLENKGLASKTIDENANQLATLFAVACVDRANSIANTTSILGLSGGLDSRSVATALHKTRIPFRAVTRKDAFRTPVREIQIAEELAKLLDLNWQSVFIEPPRGKDLLDLLRIKSGMNYLGMAFMLKFFQQVRDHHGPAVTYFTGDGGDKVLHDLRPTYHLKTMEDYLKYLLSKEHVFSLNDAANLTGLKANDILDELRRHCQAYPERSYSQKYVHFLIFERGFKWLFEGEDRNRFYFWSFAPFYSIDFFNCAMQCSDDQKAHYELYRRFLQALNPQVISIDNANWGAPIGGLKYFLYHCFRSTVEMIPSGLKKHIKALYQRHPSVVSLNCINKQFENCHAVNKYLISREWHGIAHRSNKKQLDMLLTVTGAIEELETGSSTLEQYSEEYFL